MKLNNDMVHQYDQPNKSYQGYHTNNTTHSLLYNNHNQQSSNNNNTFYDDIMIDSVDLLRYQDDIDKIFLN